MNADKLKSTEASEPSVCSICVEPLIEKSVSLSCKHAFHEVCIQQWLKRKMACPMCRTNVNPVYVWNCCKYYQVENPGNDPSKVSFLPTGTNTTESLIVFRSKPNTTTSELQNYLNYLTMDMQMWNYIASENSNSYPLALRTYTTVYRTTSVQNSENSQVETASNPGSTDVNSLTTSRSRAARHRPYNFRQSRV